VNSIILNPQYAEYLALIKAARNGAVYGAKVRFPHALVYVYYAQGGTPDQEQQGTNEEHSMVFLFRSGPYVFRRP